MIASATVGKLLNKSIF